MKALKVFSIVMIVVFSTILASLLCKYFLYQASKPKEKPKKVYIEEYVKEERHESVV